MRSRFLPKPGEPGTAHLRLRYEESVEPSLAREGKDASGNKVLISRANSTCRSGVSMGKNRVVPVTMEFSACDLQGRHLGLADFDPGGILASVQSGLDLQALRRRRGANEADDDLPALQWRATPVGGHGAEQAVLDLMPLARARGQMADTDAHTAPTLTQPTCACRA
jgi:hypothetical protein